MSIFGQIIDGDQVQDAVTSTIQTWINKYLRELELQRGMTLNSIPLPRSYTKMNELNNFPEDQSPAIIVICPGFADTPEQYDGGKYMAPFNVGVAVQLSAIDRNSTAQITKQYTAALRALLVQQSSMGGFASGFEFVNESYDELPVEDERTIGVGLVQITVWVESIVDRWAGPNNPAEGVEEPGSEWPGVATTVVDVEQK